ncbi:MAG: serine hydrolase [Bacteroidetes bacterium]|nr:serine hydrolase [Bacteroidota bacterium]
MFSKKISLNVALLIVLIACITTYFITTLLNRKVTEESAPVFTSAVVNTCKPSTVRLNGYSFIKPILFGQDLREAEKLQPVKSELESLINTYKAQGLITTAAVYLRAFNSGDWMSINENTQFNPGSLLKVPELITFMKMREKDPGLFEKTVTYAQPLVLKKQAYFISKSIEVGKTYTIKELLFYMIAYSDNNATMLLNQRMDLNIFKKVFTDLGLPNPDMSKNDIPITAKDYSLFMRILYNATYLNIEDSEYCTELLTHSDFVKGLLSGIPSELKVAHKFGEAFDGQNAHLGESGIVYINNSAYLITVMTKGRDKDKLPGVIAGLSAKVYQMMNNI